MAHGELGAELRIARLEGDDLLAPAAGLQHGAAEPRHIVQTLDIEGDGADMAVLGQDIDVIGDGQDRLIARGDDIGERQGAVVLGQVEGQIAALGDDGHAPLGPLAPEAGGEHGHALDIVQQAVAIGPDGRQIARRGHQLLLQLDPLAPHLGEASGIADRPARPHGGELAHHLHRQLGRHGDEGRIRRGRQIGEGLVAAPPADLGIGGIDRPDLPGEAGIDAIADGRRQLLPADEGDMARRQQAPQIGELRAPSHRHFSSKRNRPVSGRGNLSDSALTWQADLGGQLTAWLGLPEDALPLGVLPLRSDLIIRHAQVIDGSGSPRFRADVAVEGDRIRAVGDLGSAEAEVILDGTGCILAPGLIDVHTHDDRALIDDRAASLQDQPGRHHCGDGQLRLQPGPAATAWEPAQGIPPPGRDGRLPL